MELKKRRLLIRADANTSIGHGHIMRMIALAQAWKNKGGDVSFLCVNIPKGLEDRLRSEGCRVYRMSPGTEVGTSGDSSETGSIAEEYDAEAIVLDGYGFTLKYVQQLKSTFAGQIIGMADSMPTQEMLSTLDLCIYPCLAMSLPHESFEEKLLYGREYVLIREEFKESKVKGRKSYLEGKDISAKNLLVCMGGSDPHNVTDSILRLLGSFQHQLPKCLNIRVIAGASNPHVSKLQKRMKDLGGQLNCELMQAVDDMPDQLNWANLVICAAGGMVWESLFFDKNTAVVAIVENQLSFYHELIENQLCEGLGVALIPSSGDHLNGVQLFQWILSDETTRSLNSICSETGVDGEGPNRISKQIVAMIES